MRTEEPKSAYIAFDRYPSSKGSATHITQMVDVLRNELGPTILFCIKGTEDFQEEGIIHREFDQAIANFLERAETFSRWVASDLAGNSQLRLVHFRDIWGGLAAMEHPHIYSVYEVNGVPSIELPYRYPFLSKKTLAKLQDLEEKCFGHANKLIVPSEVIRQYLHSRGVPPEKITVITNAAFIPPLLDKAEGLPNHYCLFFGALQSWQGVTTLLKAFTYLEDLPDLHLVICSSQPEKQIRGYRRIINRMDLAEKVHWKYQLEKSVLNAIIQHALATIAPLSECSRNVVQGCSPLKIFESMANGVPVVASDLPVIREIMTSGQEGYLVAPDRPAEIARGIRLLWEDRNHAKTLGNRGREAVKNRFLWSQKKEQLAALYKDLIERPLFYEY